MINRVFDHRIIEEIQIDEMRIDRIGNRRYNYMMVAYESDNLGGTLELRGELGYIRRSHFSKPKCLQAFEAVRKGFRNSTLQYFPCKNLNSQGPTTLFVCTESTMSLHNVATPAAATGVAATPS